MWQTDGTMFWGLALSQLGISTEGIYDLGELNHEISEADACRLSRSIDRARKHF